GRAARRGDQGDGPGQQRRGLLHPAPHLPRLRGDGPQPAALPCERVHRRVAVGYLPRRGGHQARGALQGLLLAPAGPEHDPPGGLDWAVVAFLSGAAAEVVPIRSVDDRVIGEPGEVTRKIQETYFAAVRGEVEAYKGWLERVRT